MKYKLITADGIITYRKRMSLEQMQKFVGGYIEEVNMIVNKVICNEDGLLLKLPRNKLYPGFVGNIIIWETL